MTTAASEAITEARDHVENAVRTAGPVLQVLARFGFVAKGSVYVLMGALALRAALDRGGETTDQRGAMRTILHQPFGRTMLAATAVGLCGYACGASSKRCSIPSTFATMPKASAAYRYFGSGVAYAGLAVAAGRMIFVGVHGTEHRTQDWTATLMAQPAGPWLVGIVGLIVMGVGAWQIVRAVRTKLGDKLRLDRWSAPMRDWIIHFGQIGFVARGIIFCVIGVFMIAAADHHNPREAKGIGEAMRYIEGLSYGWILLTLVATGLIAYGLFQLIEARYRKIEVC
jgi:hypothetical protein